MVKYCWLLVLAAALGVSASARELKVLMIGNSYSASVQRYLPNMVRSDRKNSLILTNAYIGGCPLQRHWKNLEAGLESPELAPYTIVTRYSDPKLKTIRRSGNLPELIKQEKWDIITLQQNSPNSWKYATYQPYADHLIKYIRANAPQAEIVVHETWAYNSGNHLLSRWKIDRDEMHRRAAAAYREFAAAYGFRMIPVGDAVAAYRAGAALKVMLPTAEELRKFRYPAVPPQTDDVVGDAAWRVNPKNPDGAKVLKVDSIHFNSRGAYLQGAVWYAALFGQPAAKLKYVPRGFDADDAAVLRRCADFAVDELAKEKPVPAPAVRAK